MDFACARMGMRSSASVYNKRSTLYDACEQRNAMRCDWRKGKGGGGGITSPPCRPRQRRQMSGRGGSAGTGWTRQAPRGACRPRWGTDAPTCRPACAVPRCATSPSAASRSASLTPSRRGRSSPLLPKSDDDASSSRSLRSSSPSPPYFCGVPGAGDAGMRRWKCVRWWRLAASVMTGSMPDCTTGAISSARSSPDQPLPVPNRRRGGRCGG